MVEKYGFSTQDESLWATESQNDKTILFLHGYMSKKESFYYQVKYLSKYYGVLAPDLPDFGLAEKTKRPFSLEDYAEWVENFLKEHNKDDVIIIAHSFGARVALKLIERSNVKIRGLIFTGPAGMKPRRGLKYYYDVLRYKIYKKLRLKTENVVSKEYGELDEKMQVSFNMIVNEHLEKVAKKVAVKTIIIQGEKDLQTPKYMAKRLHRLIKGSKLYVMEKADHFCFSAKPSEFNTIAYSAIMEM